MEDQLPRGGVIRKLWIAQADLYRAHLLRLDLHSRRSRFAGAVSDQFLRDYADLAFRRPRWAPAPARESSTPSRQEAADAQAADHNFVQCINHKHDANFSAWLLCQFRY